MSELFSEAFTLPTTIFSVLLIPVILYWLGVVFGALDLEILDGLFEIFDAGDAVEAAEAAEGIEGAGAGDGLLGGVPRSISLSLVITFGWLFCFYGMRHVPELVGAAWRGAGLAAAVGLAASVLAVAAAAVAIRPLRGLLAAADAPLRGSLVGRACVIKTSRVDERFGQGEIETGGASLLVQVRSEGDQALERGSRALIYDYDAGREVFLVAPYETPEIREES